MPTTTDQRTYPHIVEQARVVHSPYGRGTVTTVDRAHGYAGVLFDGETTARHVPLSRLALQPANMPKGIAEPALFARAPYRVPPPYRICWPLDQVAGEGEVA